MTEKVPRFTFDQRVVLMSLGAGLPAVLLGLWLLTKVTLSPRLEWTLGSLAVGVWLAMSFRLRGRVVRPLQTLANMLAALREGDYSIRARGTTGDPLGLAMLEASTLSAILHDQRLDALEASNLLQKVLNEIDVAIFAFDDNGRLRLMNRAGERILARRSEEAIGQSAEDLEIAACLAMSVPQVVDMTFPGGSGRWDVRRAMFRQEGVSHQLLVLADLSHALREEERQAWKRLIRVLGHEINNSLAPIKSIAGSLQNLVEHRERVTDWEADLSRGLAVIANRSEALSRFMTSHARLAKLPPPTMGLVDVGQWVHRVVELETRMTVTVVPGPHRVIKADGDQLDQLLINLVRNAVDAALETDGAVEVSWDTENEHVGVRVADTGPGLTDTANLFVPFYTTKPKGSGIGLVLCRQIAEAHGGSLVLQNRRDDDDGGAEALLRLPAGASDQPPAPSPVITAPSQLEA